MSFLVTTRKEMEQKGWKQLDVILVSGDAYIDSPFIGVAVVGRILEAMGFKVGIIGQPNLKNGDITRLGEPKLYWGVSGGSIDSMVSNYTATKKFRNSDDYTPGGKNDKRPDRATLVYTNLIRQNFKGTVPIVLGGIEASLRRITHYDYWTNKLRKPVLFDAKADYLIYGMGEVAIREFTQALANNEDPKKVRGICYISKEPVLEDFIQLPSHQECLDDKEKYIDLFDHFYQNNDPINAKGLCQKVDSRYLIQNPPCDYLNEPEMDEIANYDYKRELHPYHKPEGKVKCLETIKFSIQTHHGCWGECNFCAIGVHQGRRIRTRSEENILQEAKEFTTYKDFKGIISDVGGPTANMYGYECTKKLKKGACETIRCVDFERLCKVMKVDHSRHLKLLRDIRKVPGVKKAFVASGLRYDFIPADKKHGYEYLKELVNHHISGQMKVAPEHTSDRVLKLMGKPGKQPLIEFKQMYDKLNKEAGKKQFLTYYLIAAHPGCEERDMHELKHFTKHELKMNPEQAQVFTPTPGTYSSVMYYTQMDPETREKIFVEKDRARKEKQKNIVIDKGYTQRRKKNGASMQS